MKVEENVPLKTLTTFRTGGPARFLLTVAKVDDLPKAHAFAQEKKLPSIAIGGGSNMLAPDKGIDAVFIRFTDSHITLGDADGETVTVHVGAGREWDAFVAYVVRKRWWGIENLSAIPGTVGAAVVQNIGAYGVALEETILRVTAFDTETSRMVTIEKKDCQFGYRTSIFKREKDRYIITSVTFVLMRRAHPRLEYRDVALAFAKKITPPTLRSIRNAIILIRKGKFPPLDEYGTAGSFFLNPVMTKEEAHAFATQYPDMPLFAMPEGGVKVPLAWILDHVLHLKGLREGSAFLWEKQALVIAADKEARSTDIVALYKHVQKKVFEKTGITVHPEVRMLSEENNL